MILERIADVPLWLGAYVEAGDIAAWDDLLTRLGATDLGSSQSAQGYIDIIMQIQGRAANLTIWGAGWAPYIELFFLAGGSRIALKWVGMDMHYDVLGAITGCGLPATSIPMCTLKGEFQKFPRKMYWNGSVA